MSEKAKWLLILRKDKKMPEEKQVSPFDTSGEEAEFKALQDELAQIEAGLENNFADFMVQNTDEKLEELFFEDKKAFYLKVQQMQNDFTKNQLESKLQRSNELKSSISQKKALGGIDEAMAVFLQKYPEADVDELMRFYAEEVPPKIQADFEKMPPEQFFEELYLLWQGLQQGQAPQQQQGQAQEQLPRELNGVPSDAGQENTSNSNLPFERL